MKHKKKFEVFLLTFLDRLLIFKTPKSKFEEVKIKLTSLISLIILIKRFKYVIAGSILFISFWMKITKKFLLKSSPYLLVSSFLINIFL